MRRVLAIIRNAPPRHLAEDTIGFAVLMLAMWLIPAMIAALKGSLQ